MTALQASGREKRLLIIFLAVLSVYAVYAGLVRPLRARRDTLAAQEISARRQLAARLRLIRRAAALAEGQPEEGKTDEQIMSGMLAEIGEAVGPAVRLVEMKPQRAQRNDLSRRFTVTLSMEGPLAEILRITHDLQSPPHDFLLEELAVEQRVGGTGLNARLTLGRITGLGAGGGR